MTRITYDSESFTYKDWYLPSVIELKKLGENKEVLDEVLSSLNCQKASGYVYWASTTTGIAQNAYAVTGTTESKMGVGTEYKVLNAVRAFFDFTDYVEFYTK